MTVADLGTPLSQSPMIHESILDSKTQSRIRSSLGDHSTTSGRMPIPTRHLGAAHWKITGRNRSGSRSTPRAAKANGVRGPGRCLVLRSGRAALLVSCHVAGRTRVHPSSISAPGNRKDGFGCRSEDVHAGSTRTPSVGHRRRSRLDDPFRLARISALERGTLWLPTRCRVPADHMGAFLWTTDGGPELLESPARRTSTIPTISSRDWRL